VGKKKPVFAKSLPYSTFCQHDDEDKHSAAKL